MPTRFFAFGIKVRLLQQNARINLTHSIVKESGKVDQISLLQDKTFTYKHITAINHARKKLRYVSNSLTTLQ